MSLIKCPECGHEVSDLAAACPQCGCPIAKSANIQMPQAPNTPQPNVTGKKRAVVTAVVVSLIIIALAGTAVWFLFFRSSDDADERVAYENILRYERDCSFDSLEVALNEYFDTYNPDAFHYSQLKDLYDRFSVERADWNAASGVSSLDAVRHFLDVHPDGFFLSCALQRQDSLFFEQALEENTQEAFELYINQFPQGKYVAEARKKMEDLDSTELSSEENGLIMEMLSRHFNALANGDETALSATLAEVINSYIGKSNPEMEDIYAYMHRMYDSGREIVFLVKDAKASKVDVAGRSIYNVQFSLEEDTYAHGQHAVALDTEAKTSEDKAEEVKPSEVKNFSGTAVLNQSMKITSLVLKQ